VLVVNNWTGVRLSATPPKKLNMKENIKYTISNSDLLILLSWIKGAEVINNGNDINIEKISQNFIDFKWSRLLMTVVLMEKAGLGDNDSDISDSEFEDVFEKSLEVYEKLDFKSIEHNLNNLNSLNIDPEIEKLADLSGIKMDQEFIDGEIKKMHKYTEIINNIFENYDFSNTNLKNKQLDILENELKRLIRNEEYEKCGEIQNKIKSLK